MFQRPGRPLRPLPSPFPNEQAARAANNGAYPPDLSVIVKARKYGADYIRALLTGYQDPPPAWRWGRACTTIGISRPADRHGECALRRHDGLRRRYARHCRTDGPRCTTFLAWAAEPEMEDRKRMGVRVILFLLVLGRPYLCRCSAASGPM